MREFYDNQDTAQKREAEKWLIEFQRSPHAWSIAHQLLSVQVRNQQNNNTQQNNETITNNKTTKQ